MDLLDSKGKFPEKWTRFYGGSVVSAYKAIHAHKIAYRDLKPENLALDADGNCIVLDFGLAKICENGKLWTFCGTPDYLAPEIIRNKGHDWGVDYWALGVLLYELTHGYPPFYAESQTSTVKKIIKGAFDMPASFSEPLGDLIRKLLCDQSKRLGRTKGGVNEICKHQWFSGFNWDSLVQKKMQAPYKPSIGNLEQLGKKDYSASRDSRAPDSDWTPEFD